MTEARLGLPEAQQPSGIVAPVFNSIVLLVGIAIPNKFSQTTLHAVEEMRPSTKPMAAQLNLLSRHVFLLMRVLPPEHNLNEGLLPTYTYTPPHPAASVRAEWVNACEHAQGLHITAAPNDSGLSVGGSWAIVPPSSWQPLQYAACLPRACGIFFAGSWFNIVELHAPKKLEIQGHGRSRICAIATHSEAQTMNGVEYALRRVVGLNTWCQIGREIRWQL